MDIHIAPQDPFSHQPTYTASNNQQGHNGFALAGEAPCFSLARLALFLSRPVLLNEFIPASPWLGVNRSRDSVSWPRPTGDSVQLHDAFRKGVRESIGTAERVAVCFSGGLDSTAVLMNAVREATSVVAITADLIDDAGVSAGARTRELIESLELTCEHEVLTRDQLHDALEFPPWSSHGPRLDAMPRINFAMNESARRFGAEVLLTGSGADELLGTGRYLLGSLLKARRFNDARLYTAAVASGGLPGLVLEGLGLVEASLPQKLRTRLYFSSSWPELLKWKPSPILTEPYSHYVEEWSEQWLRSSMSAHPVTTTSCSWAMADAWDALFPHDVHLPAGDVPEKSPFLEPAFARYAMSVPLAERYSGGLASPYHRSKSLVVGLYPQDTREALPTRKHYYSKAFTDFGCIPDAPLERCLALGLFDRHGVAAVKNDAVAMHVAQAVEFWIRGAEAAGASAVEGLDEELWPV